MPREQSAPDRTQTPVRLTASLFGPRDAAAEFQGNRGIGRKSVNDHKNMEPVWTNTRRGPQTAVSFRGSGLPRCRCNRRLHGAAAWRKVPFDPAMSPPVRSVFRWPFALVLLLAVSTFVGPNRSPAAPGDKGSDAGPLHATPEQIAGRYGPILRRNARVRHHQVLEGGTILDGDLHGKNGVIIRTVYDRNRCVLLEFTRANAPMTAADVSALLDSCAAGSTWEMGKDSTDAAKFYHRADHRAVAQWSVADDSLLVAAEGENDADTLMDHLVQ